MNISLDRSDVNILNLIQKNATLTNQDIADLTGVSATSVWRRIKNLEDIGVIKGTVALLDQKKTGLDVCAIIHVRLSRHGDKTRVEFENFIENEHATGICIRGISLRTIENLPATELRREKDELSRGCLLAMT